MPILIDRRAFLVATAGVVTARAWAGKTDASKTLRWALLSDTHIAADVADTNRDFKPFENLQTAVAQVAAKSFDGYVVNGDLARLAGHPDDYMRFGQAIDPLAAKGPLALSLGNHDDRQNAIAALTHTAGEKEPVEGKWVSVIDAGPVRVVLLDSLDHTNSTPGLLGAAQLTWLAQFIETHPAMPVIVFVHHTLDNSKTSLQDADQMLAILRAQRHVKAVFYGHSHAYKYETTDGLHLVNLPAVGYNFVDSEPVGWVEAALDAHGAALTLHAFGGNRTQDGQTQKLVWR